MFSHFLNAISIKHFNYVIEKFINKTSLRDGSDGSALEEILKDMN